ncbi:hypothetical protein JCM5350_003802 [Sporobolomyces pararoseus]
MPKISTRIPPTLSIKVPTSQTRSSSPAFGKISTYSHRLPTSGRSRRSRPGAIREVKESCVVSEEELESEEVGADLEEVTKAQITKPLPTRRRTPIHIISFGVQPPSPFQPTQSIEDPVLYRKVPPEVTRGGESLSTQSIKQQRRTASVHSISSTASTSDPSLPYLRPTSVPLSHANVSQDSLVDNSPLRSRPQLSDTSSSADTSSSRTIRPSHAAPLHRPNNLPSNLPLHPISLAPVPRRTPPDYSTTLTTIPPDQTPAAERLKRLYLCPWESKDPEIIDVQNGRHTSIGTGSGGRGGHESKVVAVTEQRKGKFRERFSIAVDRAGRRANERVEQLQEKSQPPFSSEDTTVVEIVTEDREESLGGKNKKERNVYLVKLAFITLLSLALLIDLVVLNVKMLIREDWE